MTTEIEHYTQIVFVEGEDVPDYVQDNAHFHSFYCVNCNSFNQIPSTFKTYAPKGIKWHLEMGHYVISIPGGPNVKEWREMGFQKRMVHLIRAERLWTKDQMKWAKSQPKRPVEVTECLHDFEPSPGHFYARAQGEEMPLLSKCKWCFYVTITGEPEMMKPVVDFMSHWYTGKIAEWLNKQKEEELEKMRIDAMILNNDFSDEIIEVDYTIKGED